MHSIAHERFSIDRSLPRIGLVLALYVVFGLILAVWA